ncbi:hypothetical protein [Streptomyces sp. NPDC017988]|jgi:hypothetical protein|uniref:hypothetical protein n=1 Tax=Streptomyces sp. NPDC017988 TaxID=3365025 RepID=UPI0037881385
MGLFSRKSDAEIKRIREDDIKAAHRARAWRMSSARKWEKRVIEADNELARRGEKAVKEAGRAVENARYWVEAGELDGDRSPVPAHMRRDVEKAVKEARRHGYSDAHIEYEARKATRRW